MRNTLLSTLLGLFLPLLTFANPVLEDIQGQAIPLTSLSGKWVFINYWASWCHVCLDEIPELNRFYQANKSKLVMFAVNYDGIPVAEQKALIKKFRINYPSLAKDPAFALNLGAIHGVPVTFVLNPEGVLVDTLYGGQTAASLSQVLNNPFTG